MLVEDKIVITDLCDKCGVPAKHLAAKEDLNLLFCGHHAQKYEAELFNKGFSVVETAN